MTLGRTGLELYCPEIHSKQLSSCLKNVGAEWCTTTKCWILPPCVRLGHLQKLADTYGVPLDVGVDTASRAKLLEREERLDRSLAVRTLQDVDLDGKVSPKLDPYQRVGALFLVTARRAILADGLGLGKTAQAIAAADLAGSNRILIVTKKSLLSHWVKSVRDFSITPDVAQYTVSSKSVPNTRFVVTNFDALVYRYEELCTTKWDTLVVDESTWVKNRKAARTQAVLRIAKTCSYVWFLSATMIRNQADDLWPILNAINPVMYSSYWRFRRRVCNEVEVWTTSTGRPVTRVTGLRNPDLFLAELAPIVLSRSKSILNLPNITRETLYVGMTNRQTELYEQMCYAAAAMLRNGEIRTVANAMDALGRLRDIASDPRILHPDEDQGAKTAACLDLLDNLVTGGCRVLVFSAGPTCRRYVDILAQDMRKMGFRFGLYHGGMLQQERDKTVADLNTGNIDILLATLPSAGEGLNLQAADVVVWLDKPWVPADVEQGEGRVWRRGQERDVHVYSFLCLDTVEEYVETVLAGKVATYDVLATLRVAVSKSPAK